MTDDSNAELGIIDYGAGNLRSVYNSFLAIGHRGRLIKNADDLNGVTHLVLPGVGSFGDCADSLRNQQLAQPVKEWIRQERPFLGICVGYQILFESSEETPGIPGLGVFEGKVVRFPAGDLKVPHMGWNSLNLTNPASEEWRGMNEHPYFYFVHSYFPKPENGELVSSTCEYGVTFASSIRSKNLIATQFHPEKSQKRGATLLNNFLLLK